MDETLRGFVLIALAVLVASGVSGFRRAGGDKEMLALWYYHCYAVAAVMWYLGTLAAYPSFVATEGNRYLAYAFLTIVITSILVILATFAWWAIFALYYKAVRSLAAYRAVF